jgi:hypothetical protein
VNNNFVNRSGYGSGIFVAAEIARKRQFLPKTDIYLAISGDD